jgi:hypothetical protein
MILTIDNLDGLGAVDYSAAVDAAEALTVTRTLNEPSLMKALVCLEGTALKVPVRQARLLVASAAGPILFTGYLTVEPVAIYAGVASAGPVYRYQLTGVSDEWLLDKQAAGVLPGEAYAEAAGTLLKASIGRLAPGLFTTTGVQTGRSLGVFTPDAGAATWSRHAGAIAAAGYGAYRTLNGAMTLASAGTQVHPLSEGDGSLAIAGLRLASVRELANDVTVSGATEPKACWTELFLGDGVTSVFALSGEPAAPSGGHAVLIDEAFTGATLNPNLWALSDPGSHVSLSGATSSGGGLTLNGGNGLDGQTTVLGVDQIELGGTIVIELGTVNLAAGSAGMLGGLYSGTPVLANCVAGFSVAQVAGSTVLTPVVNGLATGTPVTLAASGFYTLRLHLHAPELLRARQAYYALDPGIAGGDTASVVAFGGGLVSAPLSLVFEIRDQAASSNTPVTVLYDGTMQSSPAQATFAAVNALELFGAVGSVTITRTGTAWVRSTPPGSSTATRLAGKAAQGVDCGITSSAEGQVSFFAGRVPAANEAIAVSYRGRARAVARVADPTSLAAEAAGGSVGTARWVGTVLKPVARSSEDCENAAAAILSFSTSRAAAISGSYAAMWPLGTNTDVWPGDLLRMTAGSVTTSAIVRKVVVEERGASPEALTYKIAFANDWAEGLGLTLSEALAADALPPPLALDLIPSAGAGDPATIPSHTLANLQQIIVAASSTALTVDAGTNPPSGGGFEVRRRDHGFGMGSTASAGSGDLVLRSPVRGFTIPRAAVEETFFLRMYDASTPPLYSRESAAIVTHLPLP